MASKIETYKSESRYLRGHIKEDLADPTDSAVPEATRQLLKFHGVYLQDDRDLRRERQRQKLKPEYSFMVRLALPGGHMTAEQYLAVDRIAEEQGLRSLRLTTRQSIQLHGVKKGGLSDLLGSLNRNLVSTLAGCGDVERNLMGCPVPPVGVTRADLDRWVKTLSSLLRPRTRAYAELWIEGDRAWSTVSPADEEPLYGPTYLPRKFKTGLALQGDNCIDVFSQDLGIVAHPGADGRIEAFTVLVGGGLARSHGVEATHPRLGAPLTTVAADRLQDVVTAVVTVQRDYGNREDRRYARLKYLVETWGLDRFKAEITARVGFPLAPPRPLTFGRVEDHLGWHAIDDDRAYLGCFLPNGRIQDHPDRPYRTGLREIIARWKPEVIITPQQNLLLSGLPLKDRERIEALIARHRLGVPASLPVRHGMACPALPTCGLAITEAERVFPEVLAAIDSHWQRLGLIATDLVVRMTGCPNNCARSFLAEIGFVGRSLNSYNIYLGGLPDGSRLNVLFKDNVKLNDLVDEIVPVLEQYAAEREPDESFGAFCRRAVLAGALV